MDTIDSKQPHTPGIDDEEKIAVASATGSATGTGTGSGSGSVDHDDVRPGQVLELAHAAYAIPTQKRRKGLWGIYDHTAFQVALVGVTCFLCPGMFNALSGIGGGGQVDPKPSNDSNVALYSVFAAMAFFAGTIHNSIGSKPTLFIGALGYCLYTSSYLSYNYNQNGGFVVAAGAILGLCAAFLWTAQGALMLSYPSEGEKGRYISIFWIIFNLGAVIGSAIAMALSWDSNENTLSNGTYVVFVVLTGCGAFVSLLLKSPGTVIRNDGTPVVVPKRTSLLQLLKGGKGKTASEEGDAKDAMVAKELTLVDEFKGLIRVLMTDPWIILLFPMFLGSNWYYTYQFNVYNAYLFTLRARSLNSLIYWLSQMVGSFGIGQLLDNPRLKRTQRAWLGWGISAIFVFAVWGGTYHVGTTFDENSVKADDFKRTDIHDGKYVGLVFLYMFMGLLDSIVQCFTYWLFGAMSNDLAKLAHYAGFYKSIQSAGAAGAFGMARDGKPFMTQLGVAWAINAAGLVFALPVIAKRVTETTDALQEKTVEGREKEIKKIVEKVAELDV